MTTRPSDQPHRQPDIDRRSGPPLPLRPLPLTENARTVLAKRYLRRGPDGQPAENEHEMFWRVATHVAAAEDVIGGDSAVWARRFYDLLTEVRFFPNSPTFTGAGTPLGQLAACFVLPIDDDMGRSPSGIFQTLRDAALIQQTGGGNGFSFSRLRPKGALVRSSMGQATGPVGFLRVYDQAFGEIAQGGCLVPETLIFTAQGLLRLDEIVLHDEPGWRAHRLAVATDEGERTSTHAYYNGLSRVLRVRTDVGLDLTGTPNHKVKVLAANGCVWRRLDELKSGDAILVRLGQHKGRFRALGKPERQHGNQIMPDFPSVLDEELAFFVGYMVGDGFVAQGDRDHRIGVSVSHGSYLLDEMPRLIRRIFGQGVNVTRAQKNNDASVTFIVDNRAVKEFLQLNGLDKATSTQASVPRLIRQSPPEVVGAFLRGLFEADGSLSHHYPQLLSSSEALIREVAVLLIGLGCPVHISEQKIAETHYGRAPMWSLRITSHIGLENWKRFVGCDPRSRFSACWDFHPDLGRESSYRLPQPGYWLAPVLEATLLPQIDGRGRGRGKNYRPTSPRLRKQLLRYTRGDRQLTMSGYARLKAQNPEFAEHVRPVNDWWFVTVSAVEEAGEALTLDIEVEDNHTYLAGGWVTHNSRRGANMAVLRVDHPDVREFITCKTDESQITNFNISVGITDAFMQAVKNDDDFALINPADGSVWETVRARDLFEQIARQAHHNGEPGVLFLDAANRTNPVPHLYELEATNPCVTGDTLVATPDGWRRADEIREGDTICTVLGTGRVATVEINEAVPVYKVYLSDGAAVRVTASHQFHARDSRTGFFAPRRVDALTVGDWIRVCRTAIPDRPVPGKADLDDRTYGFLVGVFVGDGCSTPHTNDDTWNRVLEKALARLDGEMAHAAVAQGSRSVMVETKPGQVVAAWARSLPLPLVSGPEKALPACYVNSNREFLVGLLDGLFSAGGSVDRSSSHPLLRFHTASEALAQQVRLILLMFGVHGHVTTAFCDRHDVSGRAIGHGRSQYDVVVTGESFGRFFEQIHLSHPEKQHQMEEAALRCDLTGGHWAAQVVRIEPDGLETVYDLYEPKSDTWITAGYVSRGCGEQWLGPYENCCLGSINLAGHMTDDNRVDWEKLRRTVEEATRFLDDVVSANAYVPAVPQLKETALRVRRIGLGIMGLADMMYCLGVRYGSEEGQEFGAQIMEFVRYHAMRASINLAEERGPFPAITDSIYDPDNLKWEPPQPLQPYRRDWGRPPLDWEAIVEGIRRHGIRNGAQTTVAPTGTISTVAGCEGYGCEPVFALAYVRHVNDNGQDLELQYTSPLFERALRQAGLDDAAIARVVKQVNVDGTCQHIADVPEEVRRVFVVSGDVTAEEHVRMQAALQAFVDNSISKTINLPETATVEDVQRAYELAWGLGCKGLTVYVTGSRQKVVLETKAIRETRRESVGGGEETGAVEPVRQAPLPLFNDHKKPRPRMLTGKTYRLETPLGTTYVTVNENGQGQGQPFEVFLHTAKAGSDTAAVSEALGRLISYILRLASPVSPRKRLREIGRQLAGIGGGRPTGFGPARVLSLPDGIAQVLQDYLSESEAEATATPESPPLAAQEPLPLPPPSRRHAIGDLCPECGQAALVSEEGCRRCYSCGYSEC